MKRSQIHSLSLSLAVCAISLRRFHFSYSLQQNSYDRAQALSFYCLLNDFASLSAAFSVFICALFLSFFLPFFLFVAVIQHECLFMLKSHFARTVLLIIRFHHICCYRATVAVVVAASTYLQSSASFINRSLTNPIRICSCSVQMHDRAFDVAMILYTNSKIGKIETPRWRTDWQWAHQLIRKVFGSQSRMRSPKPTRFLPSRIEISFSTYAYLYVFMSALHLWQKIVQIYSKVH